MKSANKPAAFAREPKSVFREKERNSQNNMPYVQLRFLLIPQNSEKPPLRNSWFLRNLSDPPEKGKKKKEKFSSLKKKNPTRCCLSFPFRQTGIIKSETSMGKKKERKQTTIGPFHTTLLMKAKLY